MASNTGLDYTLKAEETSNGHNIHYSFPVKALVLQESWPIVFDYSVNCSKLSTSWKIGISYEQNHNTGKVSCVVSLTRVDRTTQNVEVIAKITILDQKQEYVRWPCEVCSSREMRTDETIMGKFEDSREAGIRSFVRSLDLVVRISILVRDCHLIEDFDRDKYLRDILKKLRSSKE